jgi:hypothetical protein
MQELSMSKTDSQSGGSNLIEIMALASRKRITITFRI